ncbi:MAG: glycosyltransferase family 39 protein [Pseudomonadota bacterium]
MTDRSLPVLDQLERGLRSLLDWAGTGLWRRVAVVLTVALLAALPGLSAMPVTDRDEARFVQASKQMLETGDLIDIRFQDQPRWKKPAGIYWMQAGSASLFGGVDAEIWAYRLPSVLGAVAAALLLAWAMVPLAGQRAATLAAIMLPATLLTMGEANIAKTDAVLLALSVATLGAVVRTLPEAARPSLIAPLALWAALGLAVLVKGPIVPVIALLALAALWVLRKERPRIGRLHPLPGLALMVVIVAPWLIAIWQISDGGFFEESVGKDLLGKVSEGQEKHWGPPGLYFALVWATFWPWAALIPLASNWVWSERRSQIVVLVAAWVLPFWLVVEIVPTKLPHYVLPLYPAMATLLAVWALEGTAPTSRRAAWASALLVAIPGFVLAGALIVLPAVLEGRVLWLALPFVLLGLGAVLLAAKAALSARPLAQIAASLVAALTLGGAVLQIGLPALETGFASPRIAAAAAPWRACASGPLVTAGYREPSLVFLTETGTLLATPPQAARALTEDPGTLMLLERRWLRLMEPYWDGPPPLIERAELRYFNYNRGSFEDAVLVTPDDPRWAACAP